MSPSTLQQGDSDSEDDPDYVPASSDDDDEPAPEKVEPRSHGELERTEEQKAAEKKARDDLWTSFQASVAASSSSTQPESLFVPTVKIEKGLIGHVRKYILTSTNPSFCCAIKPIPSRCDVFDDVLRSKCMASIPARGLTIAVD